MHQRAGQRVQVAEHPVSRAPCGSGRPVRAGAAPCSARPCQPRVRPPHGAGARKRAPVRTHGRLRPEGHQSSWMPLRVANSPFVAEGDERPGPADRFRRLLPLVSEACLRPSVQCLRMAPPLVRTATGPARAALPGVASGRAAPATVWPVIRLAQRLHRRGKLRHPAPADRTAPASKHQLHAAHATRGYARRRPMADAPAQARSMPSCARLSVSMAASLPIASRWAPCHFVGQASERFQRVSSVCPLGSTRMTER